MVRLPNGVLLAGDQEIKRLSPKVGDILVYSSGYPRVFLGLGNRIRPQLGS